MFLLVEQENAPEMFDRSANSTLLKALDIRGGNDSGQVRILGEGLEALRYRISLGRWIDEEAIALCHRGDSNEMKVRNAMKVNY